MSITLVGYDDFKYTVPSQEDYSDNTPIVKLNEPISDIAEKTHTIVIKHNSLNEFVKAMFLVDSLKDSCNSEYNYNLVLPYIPGARQDRINPTGDVLFTAKSVAKMINSRKFYKVLVLDPHSNYVTTQINNLHIFSLTNVAKRITKEYDGIIAPDKGAIDRAHEFDVFKSRGVTDGRKVRDVSTGKLSGFDIKVQQGKHYLMVDDICDGGGTFIGLNQKVREQGATADLYVTHGIFSKGTAELSKNFGNIYTTDSLHETPMFGVEVINIVDDMVKYASEL